MDFIYIFQNIMFMKNFGVENSKTGIFEIAIL